MQIGKTENKHILIAALSLLAALHLCAGEVLLLELSCQNTTQCKEFEYKDIAVSCEGGVCRCRNSSAAADSSEIINCSPKDYIKGNIIGGACPCRMQGAECDAEQKVCYCAPDFTVSRDRRRCLKKIAALNDRCELDAQCAASTAYAFCNATLQRCACNAGYIQQQTTCLAIVGVDKCARDEQCKPYGTTAFCAKPNCLCPATHVSTADKSNCIPIIAFGSSCAEDEQCLQLLGVGGRCRDGVCTCDTQYFPKQLVAADGSSAALHTVCEVRPALGSYCRRTEDCHQHQASDNTADEDAQVLECRFAECNCKYGHKSASNERCNEQSAGTALALMNRASLMTFKMMMIILTLRRSKVL